MTCRELTGVIIACMMLSIGTISAQTPMPASTDSSMYTVTTKEGMLVQGSLQGWESDTLVLKTRDGVTARIPASSIMNLSHGQTSAAPLRSQPISTAAIEHAPSDVEILAMHRSFRASPNLFLIPTAYPETAGDARVGLYELFFASAAYGIGGFATVQGGTLLFPHEDAMMAHATVKLTPLSGKNGALAIGGTFITHREGAETNPFALATVNLGSRRGVFLTCGAAYQTGRKNGIFVAGIDVPLSESFRIVSELLLSKAELKINYVTPGVRFHTGNFDLDFGIILPLNRPGPIFFPWIGASVLL